MYHLNISDNIANLRHQKKVTQEQLAEFIGVTKAAVSKWETGQNTPDITILPQLAAFFNVTIDELIGYSPQLSKEQIQNLYQKFAAEFATCPFDEVMEKTQTYVKRYYSCYPFLFQICVLWLNHYMIADSEKKQIEILYSISKLCDHIKENCQNIGTYNDTISLQAIVFLQLRQAQEVIDILEENIKPSPLFYQSVPILIQAYLMLGNTKKAESFAQINMYYNILSLINNAVQYLSIHTENLSICEETISRIEQVIDAYHLFQLHPNNMALFEYQAALCYALHNEKKKALKHANNYILCLSELFASDSIFLHGDNYFTSLNEWIDKLDSGGNAPRSRTLVLKEIQQSFQHPAFAILEEEPDYQKLKRKLKEIT